MNSSLCFRVIWIALLIAETIQAATPGLYNLASLNGMNLLAQILLDGHSSSRMDDSPHEICGPVRCENSRIVNSLTGLGRHISFRAIGLAETELGYRNGDTDRSNHTFLERARLIHALCRLTC